MRKIVAGIVLALVAAGCRDGQVSAPVGALSVLAPDRPSTLDEIAAGPVRALVPDEWNTMPTGSALHQGVWASPRPDAWPRIDGSVAGMAATYVDTGRTGVPSDYFYLAATGPALRRLTRSHDCRADTRRVVVDNRPRFLDGRRGSPGDYLATAEGACTVKGAPTRWAYFVAAPGYGDMRRIGIPSSGLYIVVAVAPDTRRGNGLVRRLVEGARFGNAGVRDFIAAARASAPR
ncbi:MAG: hypothetical protein WD556_03415 [Actinomycetota bacterium]